MIVIYNICLNYNYTFVNNFFQSKALWESLKILSGFFDLSQFCSSFDLDLMVPCVECRFSMAFRDGKLISRDVLAVELTFAGLKSPPQNDMIHVKDDTSHGIMITSQYMRGFQQGEHMLSRAGWWHPCWPGCPNPWMVKVEIYRYMMSCMIV